MQNIFVDVSIKISIGRGRRFFYFLGKDAQHNTRSRFFVVERTVSVVSWGAHSLRLLSKGESFSLLQTSRFAFLS